MYVSSSSDPSDGHHLSLAPFFSSYKFYSETNTAYREVISAQRPSIYIFTWGGPLDQIGYTVCHVIYFYKVNIYK